MKNTLIITLVLLTAPAVLAGTAEDRCRTALEAATRTLERVGPHDLSEAEQAEVQAAEKKAYGVCNSPAVHAELRNKAVVRWAGSLQPAAAKALLEKAVRETEVSDGNDSAALLPLLDALAGLDSNVLERREQSRQLMDRALRIRMLVFGPESIEVAQSLVYMGSFLAMDGMPDRNLGLAEELYRQAITIAEKSGPESEILQGALAMLYELVKAQPGRETEAQQLQQRIEEIHS